MKLGGFLVERVESFAEEKGEFHRFSSPKNTRIKGKKYYSGISVMATKGNYSATLEGSLPSGAVVHLEIEAYKLHPEWKRISPKRIKQFEEEMMNLARQRIEIEANGGYHPDYDYLRKIL